MREFRGSAQGWAVAMFFVTCAALFAPASAHAQQGPPIIRSIDVQYSGPATVSKERILAQIRTAVGQPYSDSTVEDDIRNLYKTGVIQNVRIFAQPEGDGGKVIVAVKTRGKTMFSFIDKSGRLDAVQLQQDLDSIKEFYQNHGYIDVDVQEIRRERKNGPLVITIGIKEGTLYHVNKLSFTGYKETTEEKIRKVIKTKEGAVYSPKQLHDDAKAIADAYGRGGYVDLVILPQGSPAGAGLIDVHYKIEEGNRSFVERINIVGNTRTKDKVIRREILVAPGDVFDTVRVDTSKKRLENLGYFSKVETYPEETGVEGRKDLVVQVEEKRTGSLNFGAGYSTVDSLIGFVELTQGKFDITNWPGLTGGGQKFRAKAQIGSQRKDFSVGLTEPYFLDRRLSLGGQAFYSEATYLSSVYSQRNYGLSIEARKPIYSWIYGVLGYSLQNYEIYDLSSGVSPLIRAEEGTTTKSMVNTGLVWDRRDNPFLTRRGERISISPFVTGGPLGGDEQIYGVDFGATKYVRVWKDVILLADVEAATVDVWDKSETKSIFGISGQAFNPDGTPAKDAMGNLIFVNNIPTEVSNVPIYDRLYLGGSNNLRS